MLHNYLLTSKGNEDYLLVYYLERGMFLRAQEVTNKLRAVSTVSYVDMHLICKLCRFPDFSEIPNFLLRNSKHTFMALFSLAKWTFIH